MTRSVVHGAAGRINQRCIYIAAVVRRTLHLLRGLEDPAILRLAGEGNTELEQLDERLRELLEEGVLVLGIAIDMLLELLVLDQGEIRRQHHQALGGLVGELHGPVPLLLLPLLVDQQLEEVVGEDGGAEIPGAVVARAVGVSAAKSVSAAQRDDLAVVKSHAVKDVTDVALVLAGIGKTAVRRTRGNVLVLTTRSPGNGGTAQLLNGTGAGQSPQVRVRNPRELL